LFASSGVYRLFLRNYREQGVSGENEQPAKHHGAGSPEARDPMQLHRLHWLGPPWQQYNNDKNCQMLQFSHWGMVPPVDLL